MAYARSRRRTRRPVRRRMSAAARRRASLRMKRMWASGVFGRRTRRAATRRRVARRSYRRIAAPRRSVRRRAANGRYRNPQSRRYHEFSSKASMCRPRRKRGAGHRVAGTFRRFRKEDRPCSTGLSSAAKLQRRKRGRFANPRRGRRTTMSTARRRQLSAEMKRRWAAARRNGRHSISLRGLGRSRR